jgi:hypothetical protein
MRALYSTVLLLVLVGCASPTTYGAVKKIYVIGKEEIVIENWDSLSPRAQEALIKLDTAAKTYDALHSSEMGGAQ